VQLAVIEMCKEAYKNPFDTMSLSERQSWATSQVAKVCKTEFHTKQQFSTSCQSGNVNLDAAYGLFGVSASGAISSAAQDQSYDAAYKKYCKHEGSSAKYDENYDLYSSTVSAAAASSFDTCVLMLPTIFQSISPNGVVLRVTDSNPQMVSFELKNYSRSSVNTIDTIQNVKSCQFGSDRYTPAKAPLKIKDVRQQYLGSCVRAQTTQFQLQI
jgi:hypothetical protein